MKIKVLKALILFLTLMLFLSCCCRDEISQARNYLIENVKNPTVSSTGGEWTVIALCKSGGIDENYKNIYLSNLKQLLNANDGIIHSKKSTEYSRVVLALCALCVNPYNFEGYNLVLPLSDYDFVVQQGINGAVYALLALNCAQYNDEDFKNRLIEYILSNQNDDGGFCISGNVSEPDITASVIRALESFCYYKKVKDCVDRASESLRKMQQDGYFTLYGVQSSESISQAIMAFSVLGDDDMVKKLKQSLKAFKKDGGYCHVQNTQASVFSTEQALMALSY